MDNLPPEKLKALWRGQLKPEDESSLGVPAAAKKTTKVEAATAASWAEEHLFERRSVVREHELWRHALEFARGSTLTLANLKAETAGRDYLREANGELTRRDVLAREWRIVQMAKKDTGRLEPLASNPPNLAQTLADDQKLALEQILASRDFVTLFRGGAGTGKSYVLRSVQEAIARRGDNTVVLAPQRQQVIDLQRDGLERTQTLAEFLQRQIMPLGAVVIVDEAGQIGGEQMLGLLESVTARNGRIILSGDTRQHGPVEASDALRAIERYSGLRAAELSAIRRQDPSRATTERERARITGYRDAVKAAAEGDVVNSFARLEAIDAVVESSPEDLRTKIVQAYVDLSERGDSALVVSQTRAEVSVLNESIREALRTRGSIPKQEQSVVTLEALDLTDAQKLDPRYYPANHVLVFNRELGRTARGATARMLGANQGGIIVEAEGKIRLVKARNADHLTICKPRDLSLSQADRLQLRANGKAVRGEILANGEVVTVKSVRASGEIDLVDGRTLPAGYRQFVRGYAVTSYGSQGKTVDHVLLGDSAIKEATNAQQWYVSISRGRKSVNIFTPDKAQLRTNVVRTGARALALDLKPPRNRHEAFRQILLHGARRGRALARAISIAFASKRKGLAEVNTTSIKP